MTHKKQPQVLTLRQAQTLIQAAKGHDLEELFTLALATGMRRSELLALHWQDTDLVEGNVYVYQTMGQEGHLLLSRHKRVLMLPEILLSLLKGDHLRKPELSVQREHLDQDNGLVFCDDKGQALSALKVHHALKRLLEQVQLPSLRFHDLRCSTISILMAMEVPIQVIEALLGFNHVNPALPTSVPMPQPAHREALEKLSLLLFG